MRRVNERIAHDYPGISLFDLNRTSLEVGDHNILYDLKSEGAIENYQFKLIYNKSLILGDSSQDAGTKFGVFNLTTEGSLDIEAIRINQGGDNLVEMKGPISLTLEPYFLWNEKYKELFPDNISCAWDTPDDYYYCNVTSDINYTDFLEMSFLFLYNDQTVIYNVPPQLYIQTFDEDGTQKKVFFYFSKNVPLSTLPGRFITNRTLGINLDLNPGTISIGPLLIHPSGPLPPDPPKPKSDKSWWSTGHTVMVVMIIVGVIIVFVAAALIWWYKYKRHHSMLEEDIFKADNDDEGSISMKGDRDRDTNKPRYPF